MNAWPVMRWTSVAQAARDPLAAPEMAGESLPDGEAGRARKAWDRLSELCHLACQAEMASSLVLDRWNAIVLGSWWSSGRGATALARARSMQRRIPTIKTSEGHHSIFTLVVLEEAKSCVSELQKSRAEDWPAWGLRLVMAWMAAGLVE